MGALTALEPSAAERTRRPKRVMIAADMEPALRARFKRTLRRRGITVERALTVLARAYLGRRIPARVTQRMRRRGRR